MDSKSAVDKHEDAPGDGMSSDTELRKSMFPPVEVDAANLLEAKKTARLVLIGTDQGLLLCSLGLECFQR